MGTYCEVSAGSAGQVSFELSASHKSTEVQHVARLNNEQISSLF